MAVGWGNLYLPCGLCRDAERRSSDGDLSKMTEFEIRKQIEAIRVSSDSPVHKARELLRLRRVLSTRLIELEKTRLQVSQTSDRSTKAMLNRMAAAAEGLEDDVLESAREALREPLNRQFARG
jgi:hypothetical protein